MDNIVSIGAFKNGMVFKKKMKKVDAQASYTIIEMCLKQLNLSKMEELDEIKKRLAETLNVLYNIGKND